MKYSIITIGLLLLFGTASIAQARLGETPEQIAARFGKTEPLLSAPSSGPWTGLHVQFFKKQGFEIQVLLANVSVGETYDASGKLTENQIQALLAANCENHEWKEFQWNGNRYWDRDDGAKAQLVNNEFTFKSKFLADKEETWKTGQIPKPPSVEGF
jgi:hypothetical protein